jgi:transmembrane sensor
MHPETMNTPNDSGRPSDALQQEAQVWLRRMTSGEVTQWDAQAFRRWQSASPLHRSAFDEAKRQWQAMKPAIGILLAADSSASKQGKSALPRRQRERRAFLGAAIGAAAAAGAAAVVYPPFGLWPSVGEWNADYRTATGEQRTIALGDAVDVAMNTQTSIRRQMTGAQLVGVDLVAGEAAIDLRRAGKSFSVTAGVGRSIAESAPSAQSAQSKQSTRFEVRNLDGNICVTCLEGTVRVEHPGGKRLLQAQQQTTYDAHAIGGVTAVAAADVSAWRNGVLVFRQAPLADVIEEINRYRPGRVVLMADSLRDSAVSGRFPIASLDAVLLQIQHSFDLNARALPGGFLVLS